MGLLAKEQDFFGLDIGSTAVRLVQLRHGGAHPALIAYGGVAIPPNLSASDSTADQDKIAEAIRQLVRENHITTRDVVVGLPSNKLFASVITTPRLPPDQLGKAIRYQAEQYIPMPVDQVKLDWAVVDQTPDGKSFEVLLMAAANNAVEKYVRMLERAGLEPLALEANAVATARSLVAAGSKAVLILDLGSLDSDVTIVYNSTPRLMRSVPVGGLTLVRSVAQGLGLDEAQASQFTYKFGLTQDKLEGQVYKAIKPSLDNLVGEIEKSVKFFASRYADVKIERLIVTGASAALPELGPFLANSTGMPVEFGNAWINVSYPANLQDKLMSLSSEYAAAVGLAGRRYM